MLHCHSSFCLLLFVCLFVSSPAIIVALTSFKNTPAIFYFLFLFIFIFIFIFFYLPCRGFGFVTYVDPAVAQRVVNMQHSLRKQVLNVSYADPKTANTNRGGSYDSSPQFNTPGVRPPMPRTQAPPPPRFYAAPQGPPPQGYAVSGYDSYPRQNSPNTVMVC